LTFDWSNIDFLSYLENLVSLSHISEVHTLLRKLSHTHTRIAWVKFTIEKFLFVGKFLCLLTLNFQLYLGIFLKYYLTVYQLVIHACSEANVRKFLFCIFPFTFQLLVWSVRKDMFLLLDALGSVDLLSDSMPSRRVCTTFGWELSAFSAKHTLFFAYSIMSCCVCFLSDWSWDFGISLHIFSHSQIFPLTFLILLSFGSF
jgi:hypothetical protein